MLKTRIITALVLLVVFLAALFWLPQRAWAAFAGVLVLPAAWEWGKLIRLPRVACGLYVLIVAAVCAALFWLAEPDAPSGRLESAIYFGASLFWMAKIGRASCRGRV